MDREPSGSMEEARGKNTRRAAKYRERRAKNPYTHAAALWADSSSRPELASHKEMRLVANDLCRRVARTAELRGVDPDRLPNLFAHVDRSADRAIREGTAVEVFKEAYIREHRLADPRPPHRNTRVDSAAAAVTREAPSPAQAQQAHGYGMPVPERNRDAPPPALHPEPFTHHQAESFNGRNLPIPDPRLPAIHDYMPGRTEPAPPGPSHDPGAVSSALRGLPFGGRLPRPAVQGGGSGARAANAYGPPTAWRGQNPSQGGPPRPGRR